MLGGAGRLGTAGVTNSVPAAPTAPIVPAGPTVRIGQPLPAFTLRDMDGRDVTASSFTGKTMIVWFFASWDKPSQRQLPVLQELQQAYASNNFTVLGVSLDSNGTNAVKAFATDHKITFPILMAEMQFIVDCGGLLAAPTMLIVEPHSNIIGRHVGVTERRVLEADLRAIFSQPKAP
jgi:peroxiredoxin